jgi:phosphatidylglycerophosphatase A
MEEHLNNKQKPVLPPWYTRFIATGFFSGYVPKAPGTAGTAVAALFFFIPGFSDPITLIPATVLLFCIGGLVADTMEKQFGQDPSIVTVDEMAGMWISMWFIPFTLVNLLLAFAIFRLLDILKAYPAGIIDKKSGGWNIMLDDVVAALYTNAVIQIALHVKIF